MKAMVKKATKKDGKAVARAKPGKDTPKVPGPVMSAPEGWGETTVGIDVGDRYSQTCMVDAAGDVIEEGRLATTPKAFRARFDGVEGLRVVIEAGAQSRWIDQVLTELGHEVIVANPRKVQVISQNEKKSDRVDAELLARLGRADPKLLAPVRHRSPEAGRGLALIRMRAALVRSRTTLINCARALVKASGARLGSCDADNFEELADDVPQELAKQLRPGLEAVRELTVQVKACNQVLEKSADQIAPAARALTAIPGVGLLTAVTFVLLVDDPQRFRSSRTVGPYLGLRPRRDQSGATDKALSISKCGDSYLRTLLVQCAHAVLRQGAPDSELRTWGLKLASQGAASKKRALTAVARKLAVLMHRMWVTGEAWDPQREATRAAERAAARQAAA